MKKLFRVGYLPPGAKAVDDYCCQEPCAIQVEAADREAAMSEAVRELRTHYRFTRTRITILYTYEVSGEMLHLPPST